MPRPPFLSEALQGACSDLLSPSSNYWKRWGRISPSALLHPLQARSFIKVGVCVDAVSITLTRFTTNGISSMLIFNTDGGCTLPLPTFCYLVGVYKLCNSELFLHRTSPRHIPLFFVFFRNGVSHPPYGTLDR